METKAKYTIHFTAECGTSFIDHSYDRKEALGLIKMYREANPFKRIFATRVVYA